MPRAHRRHLVRSVLGLVLLVGCVAGAAQLAGVTGSQNLDEGSHLELGTSDTWLVQLPDGPDASLTGAARSLARDGGGGSKVVIGSEVGDGWYEVSLPAEVSADEAQDEFAAAGAVEVEPVVPRVIYDDVPSAPSSPSTPSSPAPRAGSDVPSSPSDPPSAFSNATFQDALRSGSMRATRLSEQWAIDQDSDIDIDGGQAWSTTTGSGTVVAVIDTGVDATHPDLKGRVLPGKDFSASGTSATTDSIGHGTAVASIIAAGGVNMAGVAPDARILPLKVYGASEGSFSMSGYVQAIRYAVDNGAQVINISLGCGGDTSCYSQPEEEALAYAAEHDVVVIAAAGNGDASGRGMNNDSPATPDYPSDYDLANIVSVTSSTRLGGWSTWANYGARNVDVAAPGEGILVATPGGGYRTADGTSFSAPYASGVAALVSASKAGLAASDIRQRLIAGVTPVPELALRTVSGGTINAAASLASTVAGGADAGGQPVAVAPKAGAVVAAPPVLTWQLPAGWRSARVAVKGAGANLEVPVKPAARSLAHPAKAWRSGRYQWQLVATSPTGATVRTAWRTYTVKARVNAWISSGKVSNHGRTLKLRIGYAASEPTAKVQVTVLANGRTVHKGAARAHGSHAKGYGSPRRGSFSYAVASKSTLPVGTRLKIIVKVTAGGTTITRTSTARVA